MFTFKVDDKGLITLEIKGAKGSLKVTPEQIGQMMDDGREAIRLSNRRAKYARRAKMLNDFLA
jgi:hypothetical protein